MSNSNVTPTKSRPQYHYFYGSTDEPPSSEPAVPRPFSPGGSESETLIGESLLYTDEEGTPNNSVNDMQQVVVSSQKNSLLPPLIGTDVSASPSLYNGGENRRHPKSKLGRHGQRLWRGGNTVGRVTRIVLLVIMVLCLIVLGLFILPIHFGILGRREPGSGTGATRSFQYIPFPKVDRINYNDPASKIVNLDLFDPSLFYQGTKDRSPRGIGDAIDPILKVPFPTGAFWTNLILKPTADRGFSYPIVVYPYAYKWSDELLQASYPAMHRRIDSISIRDTFEPDITFASDESIVSRHISRFDPLSVSARFNLDSGGYWETYMVQGSPYITLKFQKATPVIKALSIFSNFACPVDSDENYNGTLDFTMNENSEENDSSSRHLKWGVCTPSTSSPLGDDNASDEELHGVQFILQTQEGQTWMLFSSEVIALKFDTLRKTTVSAVNQFTGVLRLALIPPGNKRSSSSESGTVPLSTSSGLQRLIYHSTLYPVGAKVSWEFRSGAPTPSLSTTLKRAVNDAAFGSEKPPVNRFATVTFEFETVSMTDRTSTTSVQDDLLMLSLPHHARLLKADTLLSSPSKFDLLFRCVKGLMTPVVGGTWTYDEPLTSIEFDDFNVDNFTMHPKVSSAILESMEVDVNRVLPTLDENVYGFGKQVARLAQLAHIGNIIDSSKPAPSLSSSRSRRKNHTARTTAFQSKISALAMQKLQSFLEEYLNNQIADTLLYDAKFGGVVTRNGLLDSEADFGNGRYNDHHFHYGYMLYACAIMGRLNATFVTEYGSYVDALLFDIAHSSNGDSLSVDGSFFPLARHMSWFDGHSFASGLFPFGNGKSQESSSEAVNAYFGAYLWSMVRESQDDTDSELSDFARLLLAMEIRGAQSYWHMEPPPAPTNSSTSTSTAPYLSYNSNFTKNYMVGNLGMLDAVCSTWFGTASLYVHMINFLPVTAITSELFDKPYVRKEFENVIGPLLPDVEMAWRGYVICDHAIIDPVAAWTEAQTLVSYELDAAISKSQVLYWISTRPGFALNASSIDKVEPTSPSKTNGGSSSDSSSSASCESHPGCSGQGLSGLCCPTSDGVTLTCCSDSSRL